MAQFSAVAFDIDGTLYPNSRMYLASTGFALKNAKLLNQFRQVRKEMRAIHPVEDFYKTQAEMLAERIGKTPEETRELIDRVFYSEWEQVLRHVHLYPGVISTVNFLKSRGIKMAVMSDFPVVTKLKVLNIENYFDVELSSEEVGYLKPAAEPFTELMNRLEVTPDKLLYVGNSYEYDILGSHAMGIHSAHLTRKPHRGSVADFSFSSWTELKGWLSDKV